jgi:hypothetical protein
VLWVLGIIVLSSMINAPSSLLPADVMCIATIGPRRHCLPNS